jgi:ATP-binding cassette subfamily F protein 3
VLSGGERNRYALAKMLLQPSNFLLLDEPTNHLDLRAKDVLLDALAKFTGTVVFVSHDRYFIDNLATRVFEIGGSEVHVFPGNYEDYLWRKENPQGSTPTPLVEAAGARNGDGRNGAEALKPATKPKKVNTFKLQKMQERCQELENEIARAESDIASCEQALQTFVSAEETINQTNLLNQRRSDLEKLMTEWEELSQALQSATT